MTQLTTGFAIDYLLDDCQDCPENIDGECMTESHCFEVKQMAIQALRAQADGDLVSRQAVIDAIDKWVKNMGVLIALPVSEVTPLFDSIHKLPSVKPQERIGHWIFHEIEDTLRWYECDQCGTEAVKEYDYCHGCGARMVEPQESEG